MESEKLPSKAESTPRSGDAVLSISAVVERELRKLIKTQAARQAAERKHRADEAMKQHKAPEKEKNGWAEPLQKVIHSRIEVLLKEQGLTDEDWTLSTPVAAGILKGIVEEGRIGKNDIPADYRHIVAEFCKAKGYDPDATLRALGLLWAGRMIGYSTQPTGAELNPETMRFLAGLTMNQKKKRAPSTWKSKGVRNADRNKLPRGCSRARQRSAIPRWANSTPTWKGGSCGRQNKTKPEKNTSGTSSSSLTRQKE